jgi:hypothetical protein
MLFSPGGVQAGIHRSVLPRPRLQQHDVQPLRHEVSLLTRLYSCHGSYLGWIGMQITVKRGRMYTLAGQKVPKSLTLLL